MNRILSKKAKIISAVLALGLAFQTSLFAKEESFADPALQRTVTVYSQHWNYDLNPHTAQYASEAQLLSSLYEGLFCYNPQTSEPLNALCKSYKLSRDKKRWTFTLREGAKFSDGEAITSETMKESWLNLIATPGAEYASFADCIQGAAEFRKGEAAREDVRISTPDPLTLIVHLTTPTDHLPQILCHHSFAAVSTKENVYSGPFTLKSYSEDEIVIEKNENYIDKDKVHIPAVRIVLTDKDDESVYAYNMGQADWISKNGNWNSLIQTSDLQVNSQFGTQYYFFKENNNYWSKPAFRRALIEAIPYDTLRSVYYLPATTLVFPLNGYPQVEGFSDYDTEDAILLMNQARAQEGMAPDKTLFLTIAINSDSDWEKSCALILQEAWKPLGVKVIIQGAPSGKYLSKIEKWKADLFIYGWIGDYADPLAFLDLFRSDSSLNVAKYNNAEFDSLLEQASCAESKKQHYDLLAKAEQILIDEGEVIPLSYFISTHAVNTKEMGGWFKNPLDIHPFKFLYFQENENKIPNFI